MIDNNKANEQLIKENAMLRDRIAELEESESERKRVEHDLGKRVKELRCLYGIASILDRPDLTLDELYQEVVNTTFNTVRLH